MALHRCVKISIGVLLLARVAVGQTTTQATRTDWPNWRGPDHNGVSTEQNWLGSWPEGGPRTVWKASIGVGFSSFAVCSGRVYTMGNQGDVDSVYCFDAKTGRQIWKKSYPCPTQPKNCEGGPNATPTVADSAVYTISRMGQVFCRKTDNGDLVWSKNLPDELGMKIPNWGFAGSPLVLGKLVILNAGTAGLALDKDTGKVVWQNGEQDGGYATPVPYTQSGTKCLAIFNKDSLVGVKLADGAELWKFPWRTGYDVNAADPVICSDGVFISSGYGKGCAMVKIDGEKPVELWNNKDMRNHFSSCVLVQRHLYGFDESQLKCLDTKDGKPTWSQSGLGKGSLAAADDKLIILSEKGKLVVAKASPEKFDVLAEAQILAGRCWTVPVLSDGLLYARNAAGDVVCVDLKGQ